MADHQGRFARSLLQSITGYPLRSFVTMLLSWLASSPVARWANVIVGILFTLVMGVILLAPVARGRMPPLNYYSFCAVVEIIATVAIAWRAWNWRPGASA